MKNVKFEKIGILSKNPIAKFIFASVASRELAMDRELTCKKSLVKFITGKALSKNPELKLTDIQKFYESVAAVWAGDKIVRVNENPSLQDFKQDPGARSIENGLKHYIGKQLKLFGYKIRWGSLTIVQIKRALANGTTDKLVQGCTVVKIKAPAEKQLTVGTKHSQGAPMVQTSATTVQLANAREAGEKAASAAPLEVLLENLTLAQTVKVLLKFYPAQELIIAIGATGERKVKTKAQAKKLAVVK